MTDDGSDALRVALNVAHNLSWHVYPVRIAADGRKVPTQPKPKDRPGGFHEATADPDRICWLWRNWPGPLVGVRTGETSGVSVLDLDRKHPEMHAWWQAHHARLLPTRTYSSHSGGLHLYFQHRPGLRSTVRGLPPGVEVKADGGAAVYWFGAGAPCWDASPPAPWPEWLWHIVRPAPVEPVRADPALRSDRRIAGILQTVAAAGDGTRNAVTYWGARRLAEQGLGRGAIEALILPAGLASGLPRPEVIACIASASRRATS